MLIPRVNPLNLLPSSLPRIGTGLHEPLPALPWTVHWSGHRGIVDVPRKHGSCRIRRRVPLTQIHRVTGSSVQGLWSIGKPIALMQRASFMSESSVSLIKFSLKTMKWSLIEIYRISPINTSQLHGGRQVYSVYFREEDIFYRLEVSGPHHMKFDSVWSTVGAWLKHGGSREWGESLELVEKAVARATAISLLPILEEMKADIIYVPEGGEDTADAALAEKRGGSTVYDVGGSLVKVKLIAEFEGPHDR
ncbi:hypothetical protein MMC22_003610 [Lobaria immixta]|nr:hypothetical protein [Lobaria immixta]